MLLKLTTTLDGIMTLATLDRSGTAPPAQLAGSNQLPVLPPIHATLANRLILAVAWAVVLSS